MQVDLIAYTHTDDEAISRAVGGFERAADATGGEHLLETSGRLCYLSFNRPNPKTATNKGYLQHILETGHHSVLEHASATFLIQGVSRSLTHELIRSRHLSYSQLSQRYVDEGDTKFVVPPAVARYVADEMGPDVDVDEMWNQQGIFNEIQQAYAEIVSGLTGRGLSRKQIREAARAVLPNATETKIVVTGNYRAWRHLIDLRATEHADVEIRELAVEILRQMQQVAPNAFQDFSIVTLGDGTEVAQR